MKKHFALAVLLLIFLLPFGSFAQQPGPAVRVFPDDDSLKTRRDSGMINNAVRKIVYQKPGLAIYEDYSASVEEAEADGACLSAGNIYGSYSRCATLTIPDGYDNWELRYRGGIRYNHESNTNLCLPPSWTNALTNSSGQAISLPWVVSAGETYSVCMGVTLAASSCWVVSHCLMPVLKKIDYNFTHYQTGLSKPLKSINPAGSRGASNYFSVCADGSKVSGFVISDLSMLAVPGNWRFRIKEDPTAANKAEYGYFDNPVIEGGTIKVAYTHPKMMSGNARYKLLNIEVFDVTRGKVMATYYLRVYRTPVIMVHGLNGGPNSFSIMHAVLTGIYGREQLLVANYQATNAASFNTNKQVIPDAINMSIGNMNEQGCALQKVDIVGHSMGGILARLYLQENPTRKNVNKLITINTPHSGSQLADLLRDNNMRADIKNLGCLLFLNGKCNNGAVDNLRVNSAEIDNTLNANRSKNPVPSHAIGTTSIISPTNANAVATVVLSHYLVELAKVLGNYYTYAFAGNPNDLVVTMQSQLGGLPSSCTSTYTNQYHSGAQDNTLVINRVKELLGMNPDAVPFCTTFNPPNLSYSPLPSGSAVVSNATGTLTISQPTEAKRVNYGTAFSVSAYGTNLATLTALVQASEGKMYKYEVSANALSTTFNVNADYAQGVVPVYIVGKTTAGEVLYGSRNIQVANCASTYDLTGQIVGPTYQALTTIKANGEVPYGFRVDMQANKSIQLNPGFKVGGFSVLTVGIKNCN